MVALKILSNQYQRIVDEMGFVKLTLLQDRCYFYMLLTLATAQ